MKYLIYFLILSGIVACQRPLQNIPSTQVNKFSDPEIRTIYTLQDERKTDSLILFLTHQNPAYRAEAALAFASVQDKKAIPGLRILLNDKDARVRRAAAYALGQVGDQAAESILITQLNRE